MTRTKPHRKPQHRTVRIKQYSLMDQLMASPTHPLPAHKRVHHLTAMWQGLASIETAPEPTTHDWRLCSDTVNMMETFVTEGANPIHNEAGQVVGSYWHKCDGELAAITDHSGLLADAIAAMAMAGKRHQAGGHIRLDAAGIQAVRAILEDYAALLDVLPEREVIRCHRKTEHRIAEILQGRKRPHDVEVIEI